MLFLECMSPNLLTDYSNTAKWFTINTSAEQKRKLKKEMEKCVKNY